MTTAYVLRSSDRGSDVCSSDLTGMLDRAKCEEILTHLIEPEDVAGFFVCGPGPMMDAAEEALLERGVDKHKIHIERFTADRPSAAVEAQMHALQDQARGQIGRASWRERVCQYV